IMRHSDWNAFFHAEIPEEIKTTLPKELPADEILFDILYMFLYNNFRSTHLSLISIDMVSFLPERNYV
ncbi:MAG: hypothetical protein KAJ16_11685, partial [Calditrichia bacterium]|nr:hypothetical protein [Calditrichia bacterium]